MTKSVDIKESKEESSPNESVKIKDKKDRGSLPPSKIVIRRLPPTMKKEQFLEQISPIPDHNYFHYVPADYSLSPNAFCTAYINFVNQEDIFIFRDKFDSYVFLDAKGNEFAAVVEFAPFQKIPKKKSWKDLKCGTIEQDADYKAFLESLQLPADVSLPSIDSYLEEIEAKEKELKANHGVPLVKTPLLEYVKQRKVEKQRIRDERREERRRRDIERRKQREEGRRRRKYEREKHLKEKNSKKNNENTKENHSDNSDSDTVVKVLKNPERKPEDKLVPDSSSTTNEIKKSNERSSSRQPESKYKEKNLKKKPDKQTYVKEDGDKVIKSSKLEQNKKKNIKTKPAVVETKASEKVKEKQKSTEVETKPAMRKDQKINKQADKAESTVPKACDSVESNPDTKKTNTIETDTGSQTKHSVSTKNIEDTGSNNSSDKSETAVKNEDNQLTENERKKEKRIRNKDRPSMELYRPGVRRLAKTSASVSPQKEVSSNSSSSPSPTLQMNKFSKVKNTEETEKQ